MGILELIFASQCVGCAAQGVRLCAKCARSVGVTGTSEVGVAGLDAWSGAEYAGVVRNVVLAAKQTGDRRFVGLLARLHAQAIAAALDSISATGRIGMVPIHSGARTRRGAGVDVVARMLDESLRLIHSPRNDLVVFDVLRLRKANGSQKLLGRAQRRANVQGRFHVRQVEGLGLWPLIIVDDVLTTGSTVLAASDALGAAGGQVAGATVAAHRVREL